MEQRFRVLDISDAKTASNVEYQQWRAEKLGRVALESIDSEPVEIRNLAAPSSAEKAELIRRCALNNTVLYDSPQHETDEATVRDQLLGFANSMGLHIAERHRSAGQNGIVALSVSNKAARNRYIPYSRKPMNWHTDGYYNAPDRKIRAMVLHCVSPAADGGVNRFLDPEIAYIWLRDENPAFIAALSHPTAMTIPENQEKNGTLRPASVGPVFSLDPTTGGLEMRYTARTRSISWRKDSDTQNAVAFLNDLLSNEDRFMQTVKLDAGQGILCNNSLHNRTGFDPSADSRSTRLLFRIRFHNRIKES